jgi:molybdopterin-synthase adenylyltransferase
MTLSEDEKAIYEWQMWVEGIGEAGQQKLKNASVLVSRIGGLGGCVAYQLAAAGVGKLVLAHAGNVKPSDLNRQLLMTHDWIGKPRIESARRRLHELNPRMELVTYNANVDSENAPSLVEQVDIIVDCAPIFLERFEMNRQAMLQKKPMVECAMFEWEGSITTILPGETPCLSCLTPSTPEGWRREFPVFGAVSGTVGCIAAVEVIKVLTGIGDPLYSKLLTLDLRSMEFRKRNIQRRLDCEVCGV